MGAITKSAMKAIKFYKHVVQNVEKFILKCKPEYKIPGLYVIDSIVRQSRHQFGPEKDVFAPRFARNMEETFAHLFRCSQEDKVSFKNPPRLEFSLISMTHSCFRAKSFESSTCGRKTTSLHRKLSNRSSILRTRIIQCTKLSCNSSSSNNRINRETWQMELMFRVNRRVRKRSKAAAKR